MTKSKIASCSKRPRRNFTAEQVAEMCTHCNSEAGSDIDTTTGGISSTEEEEEEELDQQLQKTCDSEVDSR